MGVGTLLQLEGRQTMKPMKPCRHPGCRSLSNNGYCDKHKTEGKPWRKKNEKPRLRGRKLQRERERLFSKQPLCVQCIADGRVSVATQRDHIIPLADGGEDVPENTQGLCVDCHDKKTNKDSKRGRG